MNRSQQCIGEHPPFSRCGLCDARLLRHLRKKQLRWFCPDCRTEMPFVKAVTDSTQLCSARLKSSGFMPSKLVASELMSSGIRFSGAKELSASKRVADAKDSSSSEKAPVNKMPVNSAAGAGYPSACG